MERTAGKAVAMPREERREDGPAKEVTAMMRVIKHLPLHPPTSFRRLCRRETHGAKVHHAMEEELIDVPIVRTKTSQAPALVIAYYLYLGITGLICMQLLQTL